MSTGHVLSLMNHATDGRGGWWGCDGEAREDASFVGLVATAVSAGVLVVAFGLLAAGVSSFWVAFPVGYGGVLPLAVALARRRVAAATRRAEREAEAETDPLAALKAAYARGELDEEAFEERVERLLADESGPGADADGGGARSVPVATAE
jgi:uncharacterized membrane protein